MQLKLSDHAKRKHQNEKWNAITIMEAYENGKLRDVQLFEGKTADNLYGVAPDGTEVGLVLSKPGLFGTRVIITGFAANKTYWENT